MADMLSKGELQGCLERGRRMGLAMATRPDDNLGHELLVYLARSGVPVMGYS